MMHKTQICASLKLNNSKRYIWAKQIYSVQRPNSVTFLRACYVSNNDFAISLLRLRDTYLVITNLLSHTIMTKYCSLQDNHVVML